MRIGITILLLVLFAAPRAFAAAPDADHAAALESFHRGTELVEAGKFQEAVDAFREALQREPASVGARVNLADCYERLGAPEIAWREYAIAAAYARKADDSRAPLARASAAALEPKVLLLNLVGTPAPAMQLRLDGYLVAPELLAQATLAVAPGRHRVELSVPGAAPTSLEVLGGPGEAREVSLAFESVQEKRSVAAALPSPPPLPLPSSPSPQRTWGFVLGGLGLAGIGVGAAFGGVALSKQSTIEAQSHDPSVGAARFYSARSSAETISAVSTAGFIAGGASLIAGIVLVALAPKAPRAAWLRVGPAGMGGAACLEF